MDKVELTKREKDVYRYIVDFRDQNLCSPSMREIASGLGLYSASTIHEHVHNMIDKGWLMPLGKNHVIIPFEKEGCT